MNLLTMDSFSKAYTDKILFDKASFHIQEGEKIGVIGANGMGKSTLLKLIAGVEETDAGEVRMGNHVKIGYLLQTPVFSEDATVLDAALKGQDCQDMGVVSNAKAMLNRLGLPEFGRPVKQLSGGQQKRAALVNVMLQKVELLVLDEPTNHLDNETARWLEDYLISYRGALVMVTHDRYFLDRVVSRIVEVDHGKVYSYPGTYAEYIGLRLQRQNMEAATERKRKSILKKELAWLARGARARSTKQKAHIQRIEELLSQEGPIEEAQVELSSVASRMGKKTIELRAVSKAYEGRKLIQDFSYIFLRQDRIGIVGPNGCGKTTLLNMIVQQTEPDSGVIEIGETIRIGYFAQNNAHMDEEMKAIEYVREVGEYIQTSDGKLTASALMERFLFDGTLQWSKIGKLSGGERRRLYLLRILIQAPNVLIFDEPTNDLDIQTLSILEDYLDAFDGIVIAVSHDRYFLDRVVNRIFAFEGEGRLRQYEGGYGDYLKACALGNPEENSGGQGRSGNSGSSSPGESSGKKKPNFTSKKLKFSYQEQRDYEKIDQEIAELEKKLGRLEKEINENVTNSVKLQELVKQQEQMVMQLEEKMERWLYLNDLAERIEAQAKG